MSALQLGAILSGATAPKPARRSPRYRRGATFLDPRTFCRPVSREERAKILFLAERLERRTKAPGRRNGVLGAVGLAVLRALLLAFLNRGNGRCDPSYAALQAATGLCVASIAAGLGRLEAAGIIEIGRRLVRESIVRVSPHTGEAETIITTIQGSNVYRFAEPAPWADALPVPASNRRPFPCRRQLSLLAKLWSQQTDFTRKGGTIPASIYLTPDDVATSLGSARKGVAA